MVVFVRMPENVVNKHNEVLGNLICFHRRGGGAVESVFIWGHYLGLHSPGYITPRVPLIIIHFKHSHKCYLTFKCTVLTLFVPFI
jgi:hypothetical protein